MGVMGEGKMALGKDEGTGKFSLAQAREAGECGCPLNQYPKMSYAVIKTGGKQYRVQEGDLIEIERLELEVGDTATFEQVLLVGDGATVRVGKPVVEGATVSGEVKEQGRRKKVVAFKFKRRKGYHKTKGHKQPVTRVEITSIIG
jgi:large subunit ribosomal protein L21